jgi:hypothetical protein
MLLIGVIEENERGTRDLIAVYDANSNPWKCLGTVGEHGKTRLVKYLYSKDSI